MGGRGRDWDTDIMGVGTDISGCLVNVIDSKNTQVTLAVLIFNDSF